MRALFFILILANLAFFGWHAGYIGPPEQKVGEPEHLNQQINPEKIRLVSADAAKGMETAARARNACVEWGSFPLQDADRAQAALAALALGDRLSSRKVEEAAQWWVFMPPQGGKTSADKKTEELKRLGITDYFVVTDEGANKWAISLGVFRTEDAARGYLASISTRGVKTARVGEREARVQKTVFQIRQVDNPLQARLAAIRKDFPGIDMHACAADDAAAVAKKS
ncbi:MAG: hypothetical protein JWN73_5091 [Betaproteobacteria bacterium]|nr:hypothetical protein [Betaproteobacteria bacterium]